MGTTNENQKSWSAPTPKRYFAYGLSLDGETTAKWKPADGAKFPKLSPGSEASLDGHAIVFTGGSPRFKGRVATLSALAGEKVEGLLFELDARQWAAVDAFERSYGGQARAVKVRAGGQLLEATAFVFASSDAPEIDEGFLAALLRGLSSAKLPADYVNARAAEALLVERVQRVGRDQGLLNRSERR
ncbi:MAG: gamma-glutamylcyclotransferase family protein [Myxococcaceae bacterium]